MRLQARGLDVVRVGERRWTRRGAAAIQAAHEAATVPSTAASGLIHERAPGDMTELTHPNEREPRRTSRSPDVETALGERVRAIRVVAGMSQAALGEAIGVSFQQVQKYEKGTDRIAASTLQGIATALGVDPGAFFDAMTPAPAGGMPDVRAVLKGAAGLQRVTDPRVRKHLVALIASLGGETQS